MDGDLKRLLEALRQESTAAHADTRRYFDVVSEATRQDIRIVAESVALINEKLDISTARLDDKIERTATETQAMISFSHADLERRMRTLEETQRSLEGSLADLQTRVDRLEGSPH
jgi:hypothetical protein